MSSFYGNPISKVNLGLGNVENKSSQMIRSEITELDVLNALDRDKVTQVVVSASQPVNTKTGDIWFVITTE